MTTRRARGLRKVKLNVWPRARDPILFFSGMAMAWWEVAAEEVAQPYILILAAGMMGLPVFLPSPDAKIPPTEPGPAEPQSEGD